MQVKEEHGRGVLIEEKIVGVVSIVHLPSEMFNDALYFKEVAESLPTDPSHDFGRWRFLRASIIFSFIAIESYINEFIKKSLEEKKLSPSTNQFLKKKANGYLGKINFGCGIDNWQGS